MSRIECRLVAVWMGCVALLAGAGMVSCQQPAAVPTPAGPSGPAGVALRTYEVPEGSQPQLVSLLRTLLQSGGHDPLGRVDALPGGRLVVLAPEPIQAGVESLLADLARSPASLPPVGSYVVDHWWVLGQPAAAQVPAAPRLAELAPALEAITQTQGPMTFALLEHLSLRSMDNEQAEIQGTYGGVDQVIAHDRGQLMAQLNVHALGSNWQTRLTVDPDQLVVLAQVGFDQRLPRDPFAAEPGVGAPAPLPDGAAEGTGATPDMAQRPWDPGPGTVLYHVFRIRPDAAAATLH